jgi:TP901 family phage tail tape measure protein
MALGAIGGAFAVRGMWNQMKDWDTYTRKIQGITHETDAGMAKLDSKIMEVSSKMGVGAMYLKQEAFGLTKVWNHGTEKIVANLEDIAVASVASASSIANTAEVYRMIDNAFSELTSKQKSNATAFLGDKAAQDMMDISYASTYAMTAAKAHNQQLNTTLAMISQLGKAGFTGSLGGVGVRQILSSLSNPAIEKNLQKMGLTFKQVNVDQNDFATVLERFVGAVERTKGKKGGDLIVQQALRSIFGESADKFAAFLGNPGEFKQLIKDSMTFDAKKVADKQMQGVANGAARLSASFEAMTIKFNTSIAPFLAAGMEGLLSAIGFLESGIKSLANDFDEVGKAVIGAITGGGVAAAVGGAIGFALTRTAAGAKIGASIGASIGGFGGAKGGYEQGIIDREARELRQKRLGQSIANQYRGRGGAKGYIRESNAQVNNAALAMQELINSSPGQGLLTTVPSLPNPYGSMTNINLVIEDRAGVKTNIQKVEKDDKGKVSVKQGGGMDYTNH